VNGLVTPPPLTLDQERRVREILGRPYQRVFAPYAQEGYAGFIGRVVEIPGCMSDGETIEAAWANLDDALFEVVADLVQDGAPIPEPFPAETDYSGRFVLRLPRSLHRQLAERADAEGVSLNTLCLTLLAAGLGVRAPQAIEEAVPPRATSKPGRAKPERAPRTRAVAEDSPPYDAKPHSRRGKA
jgi:antitoxin HicB